MTAPVILVEARPRKVADGSIVTVRFAGGGANVPYHYGAEHWRGGIVGLPKSVASLNFDNDQLGGGGVSQALEVRWGPPTNAALAEMTALYWADAAVVVRVGPEGDALPPIVSQGLVLDASADGGILAIALSDQGADLARPVLVDRYAGTGGVEGPVEFKDQIKPRSWGRCFNVAGRPIDTGANIWVFSDPRRPLRAIDQVRDQGAITDPATMRSLAWQGTAEATFAALRLAVAVEGGGVVAPSIGCVKWWTLPAGDLHADIRGETDGGYVETAPEIAARIVASRSTIALAPDALANAIAARSAPYGWRVEAEATTSSDTISDMLGGVSLSWLLIDNAIVFRAWDWTASTRVARSHDVKRRSTVKPVGSRRLGYRRNWSPMARGDLAAIVLAGDVVYGDGTPIEDLKPAQPGADKTSDNTSKDTAAVYGRPAKDVVDDISFNVDTMTETLLRYQGQQLLIDVRTLIDGKTYATVIQAVSDKADGYAAKVDLLATSVPGATALQLNANVTIAGDDRSISSRITTTEATLGAQSASIDTLYETLIDPTGATTRALFKMDVNGYVSGTVQTNNGKTSAFYIYADQFGVVSNVGGQPVKVFDIVNGELYANSLIVGRFKVGSVDSETLAAFSIRRSYSVELAGNVALPYSAGGIEVGRIVLTKDLANSALEVEWMMRLRPGGTYAGYFEISITGRGVVDQVWYWQATSEINGVRSVRGVQPYSRRFNDVPAGSVTLVLRFVYFGHDGGTGSGFVETGSMFAVEEVKR